jgi:ubiquinol-cytochrome c reductase cytochrome c1 subunit
MMKTILLRLLVVLGFVLPLAPAAANVGGYPWDSFPRTKMTDLPALQNGARIFTNYCLGCHSATYMRYNRLHDIGLDDDQIRKNLLLRPTRSATR